MPDNSQTTASIRYACELLPPPERCDRAGPGGFMGRTCQCRAEAIMRRWLFLTRERTNG